jgi:hypothetical protein
MFSKLKALGTLIEKPEEISQLWNEPIFAEFSNLNVLPLIYDENKLRCNMLVFNAKRAKEAVTRIAFVPPGERRKHPVYRFYDSENVEFPRKGGQGAEKQRKRIRHVHERKAETPTP